jgi:hypothetical protein
MVSGIPRDPWTGIIHHLIPFLFPRMKKKEHKKSNSRSHNLLQRLVTLLPSELVRVLVKRAANKLGLLPQVGSEESVGVRHSSEGGLEGVLKGLGGTGRLGVGVLDTGKLHETLDGRGGDKASTAGSGDQLQPC